MGQSTHIMGSIFRQELHSEVVTFLTRLAIQPLPLHQSNKEKSKMGASYFYILSSDWPKQVYSSIQDQVYVSLLSYTLVFTFQLNFQC